MFYMMINYSHRYRLQPIPLIIGPITSIIDVWVQLYSVDKDYYISLLHMLETLPDLININYFTSTYQKHGNRQSNCNDVSCYIVQNGCTSRVTTLKTRAMSIAQRKCRRI